MEVRIIAATAVVMLAHATIWHTIISFKKKIKKHKSSCTNGGGQTQGSTKHKHPSPLHSPRDTMCLPEIREGSYRNAEVKEGSYRNVSETGDGSYKNNSECEDEKRAPLEPPCAWKSPAIL